jgi:hypothetical protein
MAQVLKLKRTAVEGKLPTVEHLELGELAINTYDGRVFFSKNDGVPTIQELVTTNSATTGSITISGSITATSLNIVNDITANTFSGSFVGDGSGLTNIDIGQETTVSASFVSQTQVEITHGFASNNIHISVYDTNNAQIVPQSVVLTNQNTATIQFPSPESGYVVVSKGGHLVSGSLREETTVVANYSDEDVFSITHNFGTKNVFVSVYNNDDKQIIPQEVELLDDDNVQITLSNPDSGFVVVGKAGHLVQGAAFADGVVSGSAQIKTLTSYRETISGSSTYTITHSLDEEYPFVQVWNTDTKKQVIPQDIETLNTNEITLTFNDVFTGKLIITA